ncbi:hypothetical protein BC829DRAFT_195542 [Chytridium lagenaria]|nr:hypothetical protein BC829DRAFT_195542 [Chytridium lagenaria]
MNNRYCSDERAVLDLSGIVGTMKKMKVDPLNNYETPELAIPAEALIPAFPALQSFSTAMDEFDEFDDAPSVLEPSSMAPGGQLEDDASDYFPSDTEETDDRSTPASSNRRLARGIKIIENMREYFNLNYKTPSIHLFGGEDRDPPSWGARLRKYNAEEERWVEKGPVFSCFCLADPMLRSRRDWSHIIHSGRNRQQLTCQSARFIKWLSSPRSSSPCFLSWQQHYW